MLRVLNQYCHGYAFIPVSVALTSKGFFSLLEPGSSRSLEGLQRDLGANPGPLSVALEMLAVLDWVRRDKGRYTPGKGWTDHVHVIPDAMELYDYSPVDLVTSANGAETLSRWLPRVAEGWGCEAPLSLLLEGTVMLPMLIGAMQSGNPKGIAANDVGTFPAVEAMRNALLSKKWAVDSESGFQVNGVGKFMLGRSMVGGVTVSYRPMLRRVSSMLFGDTDDTLRAHDGVESHIDRSLNVLSSGFQHEKYFGDMKKVLCELFDSQRPEQQPDYIADMGCGDGSLLKGLHQAASETAGAQVKLLGIDLNQAALDEAEKTLCDLPCYLMVGDIIDPGSMLEEVSHIKEGDDGRILHVRSFLDHNRPFTPPRDKREAEDKDRINDMICGIGEGGALISFGELQQNLVEHLRAWADTAGNCGLLCLEVHAMRPRAKADHFELAEGFHFDALHAFSRQYLCEPRFFLAAMAEAGMFPRGEVLRYPKGLPYTRITLGHYVRKSYTIRFAGAGDLEGVDSDQLAFSGLDRDKWGEIILGAPDACFAALDETGAIAGMLVCTVDGSGEEGQPRSVSLEGLAVRSPKWAVRLRRHCSDYFKLMDGDTLLGGPVSIVDVENE